jgi:hypothetical protein
MAIKCKCYQARGQTMNTVSAGAYSMGAGIHILNMDCTTSTQSHDAATDNVT